MIKLLRFTFTKIIEAPQQYPTTYNTFRKMNLSLQQSITIIETMQTAPATPETGRYILNLMTYIRKVHSRAFIKSRQHLLQQVIDNMLMYPDHDMLPALLSNIQYAYQPDQYLSQACEILLNAAPSMSIKTISNCVYTIGKIARKEIQMDHHIEKVTQYNVATITLQSLITTIKLKSLDSQDPTVLTEILIGYQKLEIFDLHEHLIAQLVNLPHDKFDRIQCQLLHTLSRNQEPSANIVQLTRSLFDAMVVAINNQSITLQSMVIGLHATFDLASNELVQQCQSLFVERSGQANIQDLGMMVNVVFRKGCITKEFSQCLTVCYEALKGNADINIITQMIANMGTLINLRLLDKKFLNMYLITIKILRDKHKINRQFYEQFSKECKVIENEEIRSKYAKILFMLRQL